MKVLLTGGSGFIGSHTAVSLVIAGHEPVLLDNFSNSRKEISEKLTQILGRPVPLIFADVRDTEAVSRLLKNERIESVIHFAALKAVGESVRKPLDYYSNNVSGLLSLLVAMDEADVRSLVFSSSATVYGNPQRLPIQEEHSTSSLSPYGRTKQMCEEILSDLVEANLGWRVSILRYFNPVGAHPSGLLGEDPTGMPNNLMPLIVKAARGLIDTLPIFGNDYDTIDGSAVRDYVHVQDLAEGHIAALEALRRGQSKQIYNLGTGRGTSVMQLITAFEAANAMRVPRIITNRREGDVSEIYAAVEKAERELGWKARRTIIDMCRDSWRFAEGQQL